MYTILADKAAFATPLLILAFDKVGQDLFDLEPETLEQLLKEWNSKTLPRNVNKLNAAISLLNTNLFWQDPVTFAVTCRTLNRAAHVNAAPPDIEDVLWGITEARLITGNPEEGNEAFTESIKDYIKELLRMTGVSTKVPTLDFIEPPEPTRVYDETEQQIASFDASQDRVNQLEGGVATKMATLLKQIKDLHLDISTEAANDLEQLLRGK